MHVYNRSGISHKRILQRIEIRINKNRRVFSTVEKIRILSVVDKMVQDDSLTFAEASTAIGIDQSVISRWKKNQEQLSAVTGPGALSLHLGSWRTSKDL